MLESALIIYKVDTGRLLFEFNPSLKLESYTKDGLFCYGCRVGKKVRYQFSFSLFNTLFDIEMVMMKKLTEIFYEYFEKKENELSEQQILMKREFEEVMKITVK